MQIHDECRTADDVRARAKLNADRIKILRQAPIKLWPRPKIFEAMVRGAYPRLYPFQPSFEKLVRAAYPHSYPEPKTHTCRGIIASIGKVFELTDAELFSPRRQANLVQARQLGWGLCRHLTSMSFPAIARLWQKDPSTVLYGCHKVKPIIEVTASRIPQHASTEEWVVETHRTADSFPKLYPFINCGMALEQVRQGRAGE